MVNQSARNCNRINEDFYKRSFQSIYDELAQNVREHRTALFLACCGIISLFNYILYGTYTRWVLDMQITGYSADGKPHYEASFFQLKVQRIMCKSCPDDKKHTHALLFQLLVPYQQYSIRYIVYYVNLFFESGMSISGFCREHSKEFNYRTFKKWLDWVEKNMNVLGELGAVESRSEQNEKMHKWVKKISDQLSFWATKSLLVLDKMLFQRHRNPANTKYMKTEIMKTVENS